MRRLGSALLLLVACTGLDPSNPDVGLHVKAVVSPRLISLADTAAHPYVRVLVSNPSDQVIIVTTGGPPHSIHPDPVDSPGLLASFRIASAADPINAGPSVDSWGGPVDTIPAGESRYLEHLIIVRDWVAGWTVVPGEFRVRSYYNGQEGESVGFTVTR